MADPRFLLKTDLATVQPVIFQGRPAYSQHSRLVELLQARGQGGAASLFAEPVGGTGAVSWYGDGSGEPRAIAALSAARRTEVETRLRGRLQALEPLLDDPELGPLLKRALVLPDADAIVVLDDTVVLAGWGLAPPGVTDDEGQANQIRTVLGPYAPRLANADAGFMSAAPPPRPATPPPASPPLAATVSPPPPPPPIPRSGPVGGGSPGGGGARPLWVVPLLVLVALLFLGLGFWLAWMHFVRDMASRQVSTTVVDEAATRSAIRLQQQTNQNLELELERLRRAAIQPNVCTPEGPLGVRPSPERQPARPEAVPPPVPRQQGEAPRPFTGSLAQLLEHATVMIATAGPQGIGHGTGFFLTGDLVMTNAHVVQGASPNQIFVMSASMGRALPARLVSMTRGPGGGDVEPGQADFALLRLPQAVPGAQPLAFTPSVEKLTEVVAAGYPASVVRLEGGMRELAEGRLGTPPELVLTRGSISTIQRLESGLVVMPHSADISPGNSGGPLIDTCGRVVGINTFVSHATTVADRVKYAQKADNAVAWLGQQNTQAQVKSDACQPAQPTLPALPPQPPAAPGAPPAAGSPSGPAPAAPPSGAPPAAPSPGAPPAAAPPGAAPPAAPGAAPAAPSR